MSAAAVLVALPTLARAQSVEDLQNLSIEQLSNITVTSVSRRPEPLSEAAAAVYVITSEEIRRSGALTLAEVLRLAPNLDVARQDAQNYAISARGFNSTQASNKLLVLIDGRSVYTPLFGGVFWDQIQVPLDDIERIEVISGPGGTLWGANAVNGVINIITKNSAETLGGLADLKGGSVDQSGFLQWGGRAGENATYRVYAQGLGIGHTLLPNGLSAHDDWSNAQAGFRTDWQSGPDSVLMEGDFYRNSSISAVAENGGDVTGRWDHTFGPGLRLELQSSFSEDNRHAPGTTDALDSYDLQAQQTARLGRHEIVWGGEAHVFQDRFVNTANFFVLVPPSRTVSIFDLYAQDTWQILDRVKLTYGSKFEYSSYTGFDVLPNIRLGWNITPTNFLWAAISRAVRTPSRIDRELQAPGFVLPALSFDTEKLTAFELGYRANPTTQTSLSVSLYYNIYDELRTTNALGPNGGPPFQLGNGMEGDTYGVEAWGDWRVLPWWKLSASINLFRKDLHFKPGVVDFSHGASAGFSPGYQAMLKSSMDLPHNIEFDIDMRAVDGLPEIDIPSYIDASARIAWHATPKLEISLAGYNLFGPQHPETVIPPAAILSARRSVYLGLRYRF